MSLAGLEGKVAIVTGAGGGIGGATARRLAREGAHVVCVDRDGDAATAVADGLPGTSTAVAADLADPQDVDGLFARVTERFGRVDLVHANAGILGPVELVERMALEEFDRVTAVNVRGTFLTVRAALRAMHGRGGAVVVTSSVMGVRGAVGSGAYGASKHAVVGLVRSVAVEAAAGGVRVNAVAPGGVRTAMLDAVHDGVPGMSRADTARMLLASVPLGRDGTPDEVASAVAWLLSDESAYVTGIVLPVDGGRTAA